MMVGKKQLRKYRSWVVWPLWLGVSFVAALMLASLAGHLWASVTGGTLDAVQMMLLRVLSYLFLVAIVVAVPHVAFGRHTSLRVAGIKDLLPTWKDIGFGLAGLVVYAAMTTVVALLIKDIGWMNPQQVQDLGVGKVFGLAMVVAFIVLVVVTPLVEEYVFRGVLYGHLRERSMPAWAAMLVVSVLFGLAHGQWNVGLDVFCMSLVTCWLRESTGSIWPGVILHMIKNFFAFYVVFGAIV